MCDPVSWCKHNTYFFFGLPCLDVSQGVCSTDACRDSRLLLLLLGCLNNTLLS